MKTPATENNLCVLDFDEQGVQRGRRPYRRTRVVRPHLFDLDEINALAAEAHETCRVEVFSDVNTHRPDLNRLRGLGIDLNTIRERCSAAISETGVMGTGAEAYRISLAERLDYLTSNGAAFHNDTTGHWPRCLFWVLVLDASNCELAIPHAGERVALAAGDFIVFDPCIPHGLCRPCDAGRVRPESFQEDSRQAFVSGELLLTDAQWAELGCPWVQEPLAAFPGAIDLDTCVIDDETGAVGGPL